jgi:16S rRNA (cytosine1402-N4)-methyltransferase
LVNDLSEADLAHVIREFGEEPRARCIAHAVVSERAARPIRTTSHLASVVSGAVGGRTGRIHPATKTFQALRIVVNKEIETLEKGIEAGLGLLGAGGRIAVISFHSLEDRVVKNCFKEHAGKFESLPEGGSRWRSRLPEVLVVTKKPVMTSEEEIQVNPRARTARLRVAERKKEQHSP